MGPAANPETVSTAHLDPKYSPGQGFQFILTGGELEVSVPAHAGESHVRK